MVLVKDRVYRRCMRYGSPNRLPIAISKQLCGCSALFTESEVEAVQQWSHTPFWCEALIFRYFCRLELRIC
jgi:hypothetical protein